MTERPILFSAPMVRAIIEGRKTQTRRLVKPPAWSDAGHAGVDYPCPYGGVGDRLWVRETWCGQADPLTGCVEYNNDGNTFPVYYRASKPDLEFVDEDGFSTNKSYWRPSIHMPRHASRLTLEITDVRVQRVQDITNEDALAEGVRIPDCGNSEFDNLGDWEPRFEFEDLWDSLSKPGATWADNPWVWALTFRRIDS